MKDIKLVIFDLDGTLFRTETVDIKAINDALVKNGYEMKSDDEILNLIGLTLRDVCGVLINRVDEDSINQFARDIIAFEQPYIREYGELYDGVLNCLNTLKEKGYTLCICSNGNKEYVLGIYEKFAFFNIFDDICYSSDGISKTQAVGMLKSKYKAEKFIMVGDRTSDIEAASHNGGISIGVTYGFGKDEVSLANYVANNLQEVEKLVTDITI
ncbi:HAD family hydrolase [Clostridium estertheticum]|uniref:HAD family hydrolase n=1 Tax=Clostridium estertheticum TaxID=238834 RepID=UPI001CF52E08|nr:HAD family hydrolase [Clostridium estertheticum]MCB2356347.1 HAD family hydrolase [Clostridium estertheticum]WAG42695.1 HAD family hydrolase [Clostridium estertheticum]